MSARGIDVDEDVTISRRAGRFAVANAGVDKSRGWRGRERGRRPFSHCNEQDARWPSADATKRVPSNPENPVNPVEKKTPRLCASALEPQSRMDLWLRREMFFRRFLFMLRKCQCSTEAMMALAWVRSRVNRNVSNEQNRIKYYLIEYKYVNRIDLCDIIWYDYARKPPMEVIDHA